MTLFLRLIGVTSASDACCVGNAMEICSPTPVSIITWSKADAGVRHQQDGNMAPPELKESICRYGLLQHTIPVAV
jgi:hypothetical protein